MSINDNTTDLRCSDRVTGWSKLGTNVAKTMSTTVWTKTVAAGDPGKKVTVTLSGAAKSTITAAVYSGVDPAAPVVFTNGQQRRREHRGQAGARR